MVWLVNLKMLFCSEKMVINANTQNQLENNIFLNNKFGLIGFLKIIGIQINNYLSV